VDAQTVRTMKLETKFLRLRTPVTFGSRFGDWEVTWLDAWTRDRLSFLVMTVEIQPPSTGSGTNRRIATDAAGLKKVTESRAEYNRC
jgi:hypothetical protein